MSKASILVAILLIGVVVAAGAGYWLFSPRPVSEIVNYTSAETSLEVSRRNVTEPIGDNTQTAITGRLAVYYPMDRPAGYYLIDSLGPIELIPGPGGAGDLYRYEGATIEVTGKLVTQDSQRTLYMEKWAPAGVSAASCPARNRVD